MLTWLIRNYLVHRECELICIIIEYVSSGLNYLFRVTFHFTFLINLSLPVISLITLPVISYLIALIAPRNVIRNKVSD